jgi:RimJ/RimL family protein N-acetyltransferase
MVVIDTERLRLHPLTADDLDDFMALQEQPEVALGTASYTRELALERLETNAREWSERGHGLMAIRERESDRFLGRTGLRHWPQFDEVEVGWALRVEDWGKGYATEAAGAVVAWGFACLPLDYVTAMIHPENSRSLSVAARLGFARLRDDLLLGRPIIVHAMHRPAPSA